MAQVCTVQGLRVWLHRLCAPVQEVKGCQEVLSKLSQGWLPVTDATLDDSVSPRSHILTQRAGILLCDLCMRNTPAERDSNT